MLYSKTFYNYHYVSSPQGYKTYFFASVKHWQSPFHAFSGWYVKNKKHLTIVATCIFGLICWKGDVCSLSCIRNCVSKVSPHVCREKAEKQRGLRVLGVLFHQSPFPKAKVAIAGYFVDCVLFCAENMYRGSGNFMFGFPHSSVPACWVSFLSKPLVAWKAVW